MIMIEEIRRKFIGVDTKTKTLYKNILLSFGVKGFAILVSLVNMPVFMGYFNDDKVLGLWFTMLSMLNWILTFDLGIGNGLRNYLVIALENDDRKECSRLISSAYCSIGVMMLFFSVITFLSVPYFNWNEICNIPVESVSFSVLVQTLRILLIGVWMQFFLKLVNTILYAMQQSAIPNLLILMSNCLLLLATFVLKTDNTEENLIRLAIAYIFTANMPMVFATFFVFKTKLKKVRVSRNDWTIMHTKQIIKLGSSFLLLQLLSMASFNTREFYIMCFVDPAGVVPYQVYHKLFSLVSTFFVLATTPLWSAITQAFAQKDVEWIKKTYKKGLLLFMLFSLGSIVVITMAPLLVKIWLGQKAIEINFSYSILFALFNIEYMWITFHSHFENGMSKLKVQKIGYVISTLLLPVLSYFMVIKSVQWISVVMANIIALLPLSIMQPLYLKKSIKLLQMVNS